MVTSFLIMSYRGKNPCSTNSSIPLDPSKVRYIHIVSDEEVRSHAKTIFNVDTDQEEIVTQDYQSKHNKIASQNNQMNHHEIASQNNQMNHHEIASQNKNNFKFSSPELRCEHLLLKYSVEMENILDRYQISDKSLKKDLETLSTNLKNDYFDF